MGNKPFIQRWRVQLWLCEKPGCSGRSYFNFEGTTIGRFCEQHKLPGMVNVIVPAAQAEAVTLMPHLLDMMPGEKGPPVTEHPPSVAAPSQYYVQAAGKVVAAAAGQAAADKTCCASCGRRGHNTTTCSQQPAPTAARICGSYGRPGHDRVSCPDGGVLLRGRIPGDVNYNSPAGLPPGWCQLRRPPPAPAPLAAAPARRHPGAAPPAGKLPIAVMQRVGPPPATRLRPQAVRPHLTSFLHSLPPPDVVELRNCPPQPAPAAARLCASCRQPGHDYRACPRQLAPAPALVPKCPPISSPAPAPAPSSPISIQL